MSALGGLLDLGHELLDRARDADGPAEVAEVALDLAEDRRDGERGERQPAVRVEALDRLQQAERGDLFDVLALWTGEITTGEVTGERKKTLDELLFRPLVALGSVELEQGGDVTLPPALAEWCCQGGHIPAISVAATVQPRGV